MKKEKFYSTNLAKLLFISTTLYLGSVLTSLAFYPKKNKIVLENEKPGTKDWMLTSVRFDTCSYPNHQFCRRKEIEGFCSETSLFNGDTLKIHVSTDPVAKYKLDIYRMGYYGGNGGRLKKSLDITKGAPQTYDTPGKDNLIECNWPVSQQFIIPQDWLSGVYLGKLTTVETNAQSYIIFIVKDKRKADFLFQCSDLTWQAYNRWPYWHSMYDEGAKPWVNTNGAKISCDRPYALYTNGLPMDFAPQTNGSGEFLLWEFPLAFWMEKEGYDVSYISNIDTHKNKEELLRGKAFLSVGHDEYWTEQMMENVIRARDLGVNLLFLSGNSLDGKIFIQNATDGKKNRIIGRTQEREFKTEQDLMGASSYGVGFSDFICKQPDHWTFKGTELRKEDKIIDLIGWEYHGRPLKQDPTLIVLGEGPIRPNLFGEKNPPNYAVTIYSAPKGNFVFNAATCWWPMFLSTPPGVQNPVCNQGKQDYRKMDFPKEDKRVQKITKNLFERATLTKK